jgi:hypothetical protein
MLTAESRTRLWQIFATCYRNHANRQTKEPEKAKWLARALNAEKNAILNDQPQ